MNECLKEKNCFLKQPKTTRSGLQFFLDFTTITTIFSISPGDHRLICQDSTERTARRLQLLNIAQSIIHIATIASIMRMTPGDDLSKQPLKRQRFRDMDRYTLDN